MLPVNDEVIVPMYYNFVDGQYITYWFFYGHDPKALGIVEETLGNVMEHEAEWERIIVRLDSDNVPTSIEYSQHKCATDSYPWPTGTTSRFVTLVDDTHPVVYSAAGAHASYPVPNRDTDTASCGGVQGLGDATADGGAKWRPWDGPGLVDITTQDWYGYGGAWGEIGDAATLFRSEGTGPIGPPHMPPDTINPGEARANTVQVDETPPIVNSGELLTFGIAVSPLSPGAGALAVGGSVVALLASDPVVLAQTTLDETGAATITAEIPEDTPQGDHHIVILVENANGVTELHEIPIEVTNAPDVVTVDPARLLDTRSNGETIDDQFEGAGKVQAGTFTTVQIAGRGGVPADAVGVELNITAIQNEGRGFATLYPCTATRPTASTLNYTPGVNIANATTVALNTNGEVCVYSNHRPLRPRRRRVHSGGFGCGDGGPGTVVGHPSERGDHRRPVRRCRARSRPERSPRCRSPDAGSAR